MIRILVSGIVAGVIFFFWGFLVHAVIQFHSGTIHTVPNEAAVQAFVQAEIPRTGAYFFPAFPEERAGPNQLTDAEKEAAWEEFVERHESGPIGMMFIRKEGVAAMHPMHFIGGAIIFILTGLVASLLLSLAAPSVGGYVGRWLFVLGIGAVTVLFGEISMWNWWHMPTDYTAMLALDHLIGWALAGAAMAAVVKPLPVRPT